MDRYLSHIISDSDTVSKPPNDMDRFRDTVKEYTTLSKEIPSLARLLKVKRDRIKLLENTIGATMNGMNIGRIKTRSGVLQFQTKKNGDVKLVCSDKIIDSAPFQVSLKKHDYDVINKCNRNSILKF